MKIEKIKNKNLKNHSNNLSKKKNNESARSKVKNTKKKLGMGLSSLLSKDQELASIIKSKVKQEVRNSPFKIQQPQLSSKENQRKSILDIKNKGQNNLEFTSKLPIQQLISGKFQPRKTFEQSELEELANQPKVMELYSQSWLDQFHKAVLHMRSSQVNAGGVRQLKLHEYQ